MGKTTVSATDLIGKEATIHVHATPCRVRYGSCAVLTGTVNGTLRKFINMPAGPIGIIEVDGDLVAFDAGLDVSSGKIEIQPRGMNDKEQS